MVSLLDRAEREGLTVLACANLVAKSRSHGTFVGTPDQLADHMQLWFESGGCDGFNIMPAYFPDELDVFVDQAVPVLQRRGLFRTDTKRHDAARPSWSGVSVAQTSKILIIATRDAARMHSAAGSRGGAGSCVAAEIRAGGRALYGPGSRQCPYGLKIFSIVPSACISFIAAATASASAGP